MRALKRPHQAWPQQPAGRHRTNDELLRRIVKSTGPIGPFDKAVPLGGGLSALDFLAAGDSLRSEDLYFGEVRYDLTGEEDEAD